MITSIQKLFWIRNHYRSLFDRFYAISILNMDRNEILRSGLLELYAMGCLEGADLNMVEKALSSDPLIAEEVKKIEEGLFQYAQAHAVTPPITVKPLLLATIDYMERLKSGEVPGHPPTLNARSEIKDFESWLSHDNLPDNYDAIHARIIAYEPDKVTSIIWLRYGAPPEIHSTEYEKFLILEGNCEITLGTDVHPLKAGDYFQIPLHVTHSVKVTSAIPCKLILQRVKA